MMADTTQPTTGSEAAESTEAQPEASADRRIERTNPARRFMTPKDALQAVLDGNERFVSGTPLHPNQGADRRNALANTQEPFVSLFGCSDSRVAAEMIFDVGLGEMFVIRTAGQVTDGVVLGTLEYAVDLLSTPLLVVLGHDSCGAVTAAHDSFDSGETPGGYIDDLVARIMPSVAHARAQGREGIPGAVTQNTIDTVHRIPQRSPLIKRALREGRLEIVGLTYRLDDGRVNTVSHLGPIVDANGIPVDLLTRT
ncbi:MULTISPECIES: carbonic anhydrase [Brevibacterium]